VSVPQWGRLRAHPTGLVGSWLGDGQLGSLAASVTYMHIADGDAAHVVVHVAACM
jgi:hypothetical protein